MLLVHWEAEGKLSQEFLTCAQPFQWKLNPKLLGRVCFVELNPSLFPLLPYLLPPSTSRHFQSMTCLIINLFYLFEDEKKIPKSKKSRLRDGVWGITGKTGTGFTLACS